MGDHPPGLFRLCGKYCLRHKIGSGSHGALQHLYAFSFNWLICRLLLGDVYLGTNVLTSEVVAAKMEPASAERPKLRREFKIYRALGDYRGIPRALWFGTERGYNAIVMSRLGSSLEELFDVCGRRFGLKTVLLLAEQLVCTTLPIIIFDISTDFTVDLTPSVYS